MEPTLEIAKDPSFYFQDTDYNDYRELVCFERPACFTLHYYFGFSTSRLWLYDRFAFEFRGGQLVELSNALSEFLREQSVVSNVELKRGESFRDLLARELGASSSLVAPLTARIGNSTVVTSFTLERSTDKTVACTCLRGDDFFIGKAFAISDIENRLYFENDRVKLHRLNIPDWMRSNHESPTQLWQRAHLSERMIAKLQEYYLHQGQSGRKHLHAYVGSRRAELGAFMRKAGEGFTNVLLVEFFWPMLFAYSPFHVFLRYVIREGVNPGFSLNAEDLKKQLDDVVLQAQQITNIAYMFGRQPDERNFDRFLGAMNGMVNLHGAIEETLMESLKL